MIGRLAEDRELQDRELIVGIDLGTTNSEIAVVQDGVPRVLSEGGVAIVPSVVGLDEEGGILVGEPAANQLVHAPERTVRSVKRRMGSREKTRMGEDEYTPQELSAIILRHLKELAERQLGREVRKAVITIPAFFNDAQRQATREAGELAGLEVVRILHEPTAASLVYEADHCRGGGEARRVLVYDMGGGTFDVSVVEIRDGVLQVLASHGDTQLGGDDFDLLLLEHVAARFREERDVDLLSDPRTRARLLRAVEHAKRSLSFQPFVMIEEEFVGRAEGEPLHLEVEVSRDEYEGLIRPLVKRSMSSVQAALHDAGILARDIDRIVLVGGATRTPLIQRELEARAGTKPHFDVDPDLCVALGAASQGALIAGEEVGRVLVDITPHSLGIQCLDFEDGRPELERFSVVIPKGTALPARRSEVYCTCEDEQEEAEIRVFQGEDPIAPRNTKLGDFRITGLSPQPEGNPIIVDFQLNLDGTLEVVAREKATRTKAQIVIEDGLHAFDEEERARAERRLARLYGNPEVGPGAEAAPANGRAAESAGSDQALSPEARRLLETAGRAEALLAKLAAEDRGDAGALLARVREGIIAGRIEDARDAHAELEDLLFYVEES